MGKALLIAASTVGGMLIESQLHLAEKAGNAISALFKRDEPTLPEPTEAKKK